MATPSKAPSTFFAGDTLSWREVVSAYPPADGWHLEAGIGNGTDFYQATSTPDADAHLFTVDSTTTSSWKAGDYTLAVAAVRGNERHTLYTQQIVIAPSPFSASDQRSHAQKALDAIEAWIENKDMGVADYQIAGRSVKYYTVDELIRLRQYYRGQVQKEQRAASLASGKKPRRRLLIRMPA